MGLNVATDHSRSQMIADESIILSLVQRDGLALKYASEALQNDRAIVLAAVQQDGLALVYASEELRIMNMAIFLK
ncbi:MAG: DUF4116 domain-containing protein [Chlamydia sp.]